MIIQETEIRLCTKRQKEIITQINSLNRNEKYDFIISFGKKIDLLPKNDQNNINLIQGCQNQSYIKGFSFNQKIKFKGDSSSLISRGILCIMTHIYNDMSPESIINCPCIIMESVDIFTFLSISRSAGFVHVMRAQKRIALNMLSNNNT